MATYQPLMAKAAEPERSESEKRGTWVSGSEILHREKTGNVKDVKSLFSSVFDFLSGGGVVMVEAVMLRLKGQNSLVEAEK